VTEELIWQSLIGVEAPGLRNSLRYGRFNAYIADTELHTLLVLAERQDNPGTSITNAYERYAAAVCEKEGVDAERCLFFELYIDPGRRKGGYPVVGRDGRKGTAILDRVVVDKREANTQWFPGKELGEIVWNSLNCSFELDWSYAVPRRLTADG